MADSNDDAELTDAELMADALGLMREEHERVAGLLMFAIDVVDDTQDKGHRVDTAKMRREFGRKIRESLVGRELCLGQLGDPMAELCCGECGAEADLLADDPLDDWQVGRADDGLIGVLCPTCCTTDDDEVTASPRRYGVLDLFEEALSLVDARVDRLTADDPHMPMLTALLHGLQGSVRKAREAS
jgi:hypothetical protein